MCRATDIAKKIACFIHLGMNDEAVRLVLENAEDRTVLREINACDGHVREWAYWASPGGSLLESVTRDPSCEMPLYLESYVAGLSEDWEDRLGRNSYG